MKQHNRRETAFSLKLTSLVVVVGYSEAVLSVDGNLMIKLNDDTYGRFDNYECFVHNLDYQASRWTDYYNVLDKRPIRYSMGGRSYKALELV